METVREKTSKSAPLTITRDKWEIEAHEADETRTRYRRAMNPPASASPPDELDALHRLLTVACDNAGGAPPSISHEVRARATTMFESILDATLPRTREHAKFPRDPAVVRSLLGEARLAMTWYTAMEDRSVKSVRGGNYLRQRVRLVELWARKNAPINASDRQVEAIVRRCKTHVLAMGAKNEKMSDAYILVAALFDSTPDMVKKVRNRRRSDR